MEDDQKNEKKKIGSVYWQHWQQDVFLVWFPRMFIV